MPNTSSSSQDVFPREIGMADSGYGPRYVNLEQRSQAMRLRAQVFFGVLLVSLILGLGINFSRSAIYQATARAQITPPGKVVTGDSRAEVMSNEAKQALLIEMEVLNSRPLLEKAVEKLRAQGLFKNQSNDPVQALQRMLKLSNIEGTPVVQLQAQDSQKNLVAPLLNTLLEVYRAQQAVAGDSSSQTQLEAARDEVKVIEAKVDEKRRALESLRLRANIVSGERDENQTLARLKGLNASLNAATDHEATAAGRVRAIEQAITEGKRTPLAKDNPTVAAIEARLSQAKEEWRALERQFTPQYLDMDPNTRTMKTRMANLEQQLEEERKKSQQMALADASEELAGVQATAQRLQQQMTGDKQEVNIFSRNFGQFQSLQEDLKSLELVRTTATQKLLALQSSEIARKPRLVILEPAVTPDAPWQPQYWRDAGMVLLSAIVLSFLSVWFVEFFNRKEAAPSGPSRGVLPQPWMVHPQAIPTLDTRGRLPQQPQQVQPVPPLLTHPLARELDANEVQQLLQASTPKNRPLLACLLCGLSIDEVIGLQWQHLDAARNSLRVPGKASRELPLAAPLRTWADASGANATLPSPSAALFTQDADHPLEAADVHAIVTSSAFDADLIEPQSITPAALRHTYIAFLVRQGLRFSELGQLVGNLSAEALNALAPLAEAAPPGPRVGVTEVAQLLPCLRSKN